MARYRDARRCVYGLSRHRRVAPAPVTDMQMRHELPHHPALRSRRLRVRQPGSLVQSVAIALRRDLNGQRLATDLAVVQERAAGERLAYSARDAVVHISALGQDFVGGAQGSDFIPTRAPAGAGRLGKG